MITPLVGVPLATSEPHLSSSHLFFSFSFFLHFIFFLKPIEDVDVEDLPGTAGSSPWRTYRGSSSRCCSRASPPPGEGGLAAAPPSPRGRAGSAAPPVGERRAAAAAAPRTGTNRARRGRMGPRRSAVGGGRRATAAAAPPRDGAVPRVGDAGPPPLLGWGAPGALHAADASKCRPRALWERAAAARVGRRNADSAWGR